MGNSVPNIDSDDEFDVPPDKSKNWKVVNLEKFSFISKPLLDLAKDYAESLKLNRVQKEKGQFHVLGGTKPTLHAFTEALSIEKLLTVGLKSWLGWKILFTNGDEKTFCKLVPNLKTWVVKGMLNIDEWEDKSCQLKNLVELEIHDSQLFYGAFLQSLPSIKSLTIVSVPTVKILREKDEYTVGSPAFSLSLTDLNVECSSTVEISLFELPNLKNLSISAVEQNLEIVKYNRCKLSNLSITEMKNLSKIWFHDFQIDTLITHSLPNLQIFKLGVMNENPKINVKCTKRDFLNEFTKELVGVLDRRLVDALSRGFFEEKEENGSNEPNEPPEYPFDYEIGIDDPFTKKFLAYDKKNDIFMPTKNKPKKPIKSLRRLRVPKTSSWMNWGSVWNNVEQKKDFLTLFPYLQVVIFENVSNCNECRSGGKIGNLSLRNLYLTVLVLENNSNFYGSFCDPFVNLQKLKIIKTTNFKIDVTPNQQPSRQKVMKNLRKLYVLQSTNLDIDLRLVPNLRHLRLQKTLNVRIYKSSECKLEKLELREMTYHWHITMLNPGNRWWPENIKKRMTEMYKNQKNQVFKYLKRFQFQNKEGSSPRLDIISENEPAIRRFLSNMNGNFGHGNSQDLQNLPRYSVASPSESEVNNVVSSAFVCTGICLDVFLLIFSFVGDRGTFYKVMNSSIWFSRLIKREENNWIFRKHEFKLSKYPPSSPVKYVRKLCVDEVNKPWVSPQTQGLWASQKTEERFVESFPNLEKLVVRNFHLGACRTHLYDRVEYYLLKKIEEIHVIDCRTANIDFANSMRLVKRFYVKYDIERLKAMARLDIVRKEDLQTRYMSAILTQRQGQPIYPLMYPNLQIIDCVGVGAVLIQLVIIPNVKTIRVEKFNTIQIISCCFCQVQELLFFENMNNTPGTIAFSSPKGDEKDEEGKVCQLYGQLCRFVYTDSQRKVDVTNVPFLRRFFGNLVGVGKQRSLAVNDEIFGDPKDEWEKSHVDEMRLKVYELQMELEKTKK